jgi:hypothetical protein
MEYEEAHGQKNPQCSVLTRPQHLNLILTLESYRNPLIHPHLLQGEENQIEIEEKKRHNQIFIWAISQP